MRSMLSPFHSASRDSFSLLLHTTTTLVCSESPASSRHFQRFASMLLSLVRLIYTEVSLEQFERLRAETIASLKFAASGAITASDLDAFLTAAGLTIACLVEASDLHVPAQCHAQEIKQLALGERRERGDVPRTDKLYDALPFYFSTQRDPVTVDKLTMSERALLSFLFLRDSIVALADVVSHPESYLLAPINTMLYWLSAHPAVMTAGHEDVVNLRVKLAPLAITIHRQLLEADVSEELLRCALPEDSALVGFVPVPLWYPADHIPCEFGQSSEQSRRNEIDGESGVEPPPLRGASGSAPEEEDSEEVILLKGPLFCLDSEKDPVCANEPATGRGRAATRMMRFWSLTSRFPEVQARILDSQRLERRQRRTGVTAPKLGAVDAAFPWRVGARQGSFDASDARRPSCRAHAVAQRAGKAGAPPANSRTSHEAASQQGQEPRSRSARPSRRPKGRHPIPVPATFVTPPDYYHHAPNPLVVIDGSNVAMKHGEGSPSPLGKKFSVRGIQIAVDHFLRQRHPVGFGSHPALYLAGFAGGRVCAGQFDG
eukprot:Polyplicarium_translucidae@DN3313_c0_g1_i2.p1